MKTASMLRFWLFMFCSGLLLYSCTQPVVLQDKRIESTVAVQIDALNRQLINGFARQDPAQVMAVSSEQTAKRGVNAFLAVMQQAGKNFDISHYHILNQFHLQQVKEGTTVKVGTGGNKGYTFSFPAGNSELFVSMGYFEQPVVSPALVVVYGKYGSKWKLNMLQVGRLRIEGKDANAWYEQAKADLKRNHLADAADDMALCNLVNEPANQFWRYTQEPRFVEFDKTLTTALNKRYVFPLEFKAIATRPAVFRIFPQLTKEGYFPMVVYKTNVNIKDTTALSKECDQMHHQVGNVFDGIKDGKKYILYRACSKIPVNGEAVPNYGFVRKVDPL